MIDTDPNPTAPTLDLHVTCLERIGLNPALKRSVMQALIEDARLRPFRVVEVQRAQVMLHDGQASHAARLAARVAA